MQTVKQAHTSVIVAASLAALSPAAAVDDDEDDLSLCLVSTIPLPFFRSVATVAIARENGNAGNVFPYT